MHKNLLLWGYPNQAIEEVESKGIPTESSGDIGISEVFNPKKTHPDFVFPWVVTFTTGELPPMPAEVFITIKNFKSIEFDYLPYGDFFIVSEKLLSFMREQGYDYKFDMSVANLVNTKGKLLSEEKFFFVRKDARLIKEELIWQHGDTDEDEIVQVGTNSEKNVLFTDEGGYDSCLFINEKLKKDIESKFKNPFLYTVSQWNQLDEDYFDF